MTRKDRWAKRPVVQEYFTFRDEVQARRVKLPIPSKVIFWMPMPPSWSKEKQRGHDGSAHEQTPDIDNLLKALLEALFHEDKIVWSVWPEKRWSSRPGIEVLPISLCASSAEAA
jgi:Holliday junction resolvase RusA-like endonuclease